MQSKVKVCCRLSLTLQANYKYLCIAFVVVSFSFYPFLFAVYIKSAFVVVVVFIVYCFRAEITVTVASKQQL